MIQYSLKCADGHSFDSWFQSSAAYDTLQAAGHVACAICGTARVEKAPMAPRVTAGAGADPSARPQDRPLSHPAHPAEALLAAFRRHVETTADYVGRDFVREARAIHEGDAPDRPIWGEARPHEARKLAEDGVPVAPLPFRPTRKLQ